MKIVVTARTLNEKNNVMRFCKSYWWADEVLLADGGSEDSTVLFAKKFPNVKVRYFGDKVYNNGYWRNPHGKHINFLIDWAYSLHPDWIIFDDCDCYPTDSLQKVARDILRTNHKSAAFAYRLYKYGADQYFPEMNEPGQSLWAWRPELDIRANEADPWSHEMINMPKEHQISRLHEPFCLIHNFAPNPDVIEEKMRFYRESGQHPNIKHPLEYGGRLAPLPEWAHG